jgi:FixJ family two-component response regulator
MLRVLPHTGSAGAAAQIVHVVEDDPSARAATTRFLRVAGHVVRAYGTAAEFVESFSPHTRGCLVLDLNLPGQNGLDLQETLAASPDPLPIVFLTGAAEIRDSVRAMKSGAVDFLTKSADGKQLLDAVERALARDSEDRARRERRRSLQERYERLTAREREVFPHLISGRLNKQICADLGAAEATIKIHRHRVLTKMGADSIADLVRMAADLEIQTAASAG